MTGGLPHSYRRTYQAARDLVAIPMGSTYAERLPLVLAALRGRSPDELRYLLHNPERIGIEGYDRDAPTGHLWLIEVVDRDEETVISVLDHVGVPLRLVRDDEPRPEQPRRTLATAIAVVVMWCLSAAIALALTVRIGLLTWELVVGLGAVVGSCKLPPTSDERGAMVEEVTST